MTYLWSQRHKSHGKKKILSNLHYDVILVIIEIFI